MPESHEYQQRWSLVGLWVQTADLWLVNRVDIKITTNAARDDVH